MAQDPVYKRQNIQIETPTRLDPTNLKEGIAASQRLSQALDRVSNEAFKELTVEMQKRGEQFGINNAPTLEEIDVANESGVMMADLFESDSTVFGRAANDMQAKVVRTQLEYDTRNDLNAIKELVKLGKINDVETLESELNAIINGRYNGLAGANAKEAMSLKASIVGRAREIKKYGIGKIVEANQQIAEFELNQMIRDEQANHLDIIEGMPVKDPALFKEQTKADVNAIISKAGFLGVKKQIAITNKMLEYQDEVMAQSIINSLATNPDFLENPEKYISGLRRRQAGEYTDMFQSLPMSKQKEIIKEAKSLYKDQAATEAHAKDRKDRQLTFEINNAVLQLNKTTDENEIQDIRNNLLNLSASNPDILPADDVVKIMKNQYEPTAEEETSDKARRFKNRIYLGDFGSYDQMRKAAQGLGFSNVLINTKFANALDQKAFGVIDKAAEEFARKNSGRKPDGNKIKTKTNDTKKKLIELSQDPDFDLQEAVDVLQQEEDNKAANRKIQNTVEDIKKDMTMTFAGIKDLYDEDIFSGKYASDSPEVEELIDQIRAVNDEAANTILGYMITIDKQNEILGNE